MLYEIKTFCCASLSLSLCNDLETVIRRYSARIECFLIFRTDDFVPNIWYQSLHSIRSFNPLSAVVTACTAFGSSLHHGLHSIRVIRRKREEEQKRGLHLIALDPLAWSKPSGCTLFLVIVTARGEIPLCIIDTIVLHSVKRHPKRSLNAARCSL